MTSFANKLLAVGTMFVALAAGEGRAAEIPDGARLYISNQGQAWLKTHFESVLLANGLDLSRRRVEKTEFRLNELTGARSERGSARANRPSPVQRLASKLGACFRGLPFRDLSELRLSMLDYGYELKFDHLTVEIDRRGPARYGLDRGVVALLRGDTSEFRFDLPRLRAFYDEGPGFLGTLGLDGGKANLAAGRRRPAWMEIPVLIDTDAQGLNVRVLGIRTNFTQVTLEASFEALLLPTMTIVIDGHSYSFDRVAFEQEVRKLLPDILPPLQGVVKTFFEKDGAGLIFQPQMDDLAKAATARFTVPLGAVDQPEQVDVLMTPTQLKSDDHDFMLAFRASMTDPLASEARPFLALGAAGAPTLSTVPAEGYDVAIALHPAVLNGILNRMFSHKFLSKVHVGDSEPADLDAAPYFVLNQRDPRRVLVHVRISVDAHQWMVRSKIPLDFDLRLRIAANPRNQVELIPEEILLDSVVVDTSRTRTFLGLFKDRVKSGVMARLKKANDGFRTSPSVVRRVASLDSVMGVPLRLVDVLADAGNVILFSQWKLP